MANDDYLPPGYGPPSPVVGAPYTGGWAPGLQGAKGDKGDKGDPGPPGPAGAGSATLEQVGYARTLGGRLLVLFPKAFWVDWKYVGVTIPEPVPTTMPTGAMALGFVGGDIAWMIPPNEDYTQVTIGGAAHGGWEYVLPANVWPMVVFGGVAYLVDGNTGEWYWTDGTAAPALITGGTLSFAGVLMQGWFIDAGGDWCKVDTSTGAWIIVTPPTGVDPQYAYPIVETGDTLAWDGTGWHHLSPAGVWTPVAGGPTNPLPYTRKVTFTDTETWVGANTPGDGRWWSPGGGWRADHRNYAYTQMWGLADGAVWTDGTDWWQTKPGEWNGLPTPDPLLGFDSFAGDYDRVVGYNSHDGYWGYSTNSHPWVLGLRERVYLLEQAPGGGVPGPPGPAGRDAAALPDGLSIIGIHPETGEIIVDGARPYRVTEDPVYGYLDFELIEDVAYVTLWGDKWFTQSIVSMEEGLVFGILGESVEWVVGWTEPTLFSNVIACYIRDQETGTGSWFWTDGTAPMGPTTGTGPDSTNAALRYGVVFSFVWLSEESPGTEWKRLNSSGEWVTTTAPSGVTMETSIPAGLTDYVLSWDGTAWWSCDPEGTWASVSGGPSNPMLDDRDYRSVNTDTHAGVLVPGSDPDTMVLWRWSPTEGWDNTVTGEWKTIQSLTDGYLMMDKYDTWYTWTQGGFRQYDVNSRLPKGFGSFVVSGSTNMILFRGDYEVSVLAPAHSVPFAPTATFLKCMENRLNALENP